MKSLVTGGAGFIGSHLAEELSEEDEVIILDDLSTGKMENIAGIIGTDEVEFYRGSVTDLDLLEEIAEDIDRIFHLAAIASVPKSVKDPGRTNEVNVNGTLNVLMAARGGGAEKVVMASSTAVYGEGEELPKREDMLPELSSPYAASKLCGENYCKSFHDSYGLETVALRYFNVFGPRQDPHSEYAAVIPNFILRLLEGEPPVIYGDGEQTRDFVSVEDVVRANLLAAEEGKVGTFNVGRGESISINELAEVLIDVMGADVSPVHEEEREGDLKHSLADISKAERDLGYEPEVGFREGLEDTVEWYRGAYG